MQRRQSIAAIASFGLLAFGHSSAVRAASKEEIDAKVIQAIEEFYKQTSAGKTLAQKAAGTWRRGRVRFPGRPSSAA